MRKLQIACKSGYKNEALENWASAQINYYFLEEIYFSFSLSTKKVCQCSVIEKKILYPYLFFLLHIYCFSGFLPSLDMACTSHITQIQFQSNGNGY